MTPEEHVTRAEWLLEMAEGKRTSDYFHTIQALMAKADIHLRLAEWKAAGSTTRPPIGGTEASERSGSDGNN